MAFSTCSEFTEFIIPNSVKKIGHRAFWGCSLLKSITVPDSVEDIAVNAFESIPQIYYHGNATGSPWGAGKVN